MSTAASASDASRTGTTPASLPEDEFSVMLRLRDHYTQVVDFGMDGVAPLMTDEPAPLGWDRGPNPTRLLGAAIGSCLGASLLFCLRKARVDVTDLQTTIEGTLTRNASGRVRVGSLRVRLAPTVAESDQPRLGRCLELFEDFCVVTQSVRDGIDVQVEIAPGT